MKISPETLASIFCARYEDGGYTGVLDACRLLDDGVLSSIRSACEAECTCGGIDPDLAAVGCAACRVWARLRGDG